jgi:uncharacterized membrane protein YebE (DUF533 family)
MKPQHQKWALIVLIGLVAYLGYQNYQLKAELEA